MDRQVRNPVTGWWENLPEPRRVAVWHTVFYALMAVAGVSVLVDPPTFLTLGLGGHVLTTFWAGLLVLGGVVGTPSVLPGAYWAERIALAAVGLALVLYIVAMAELQSNVPINVAYQTVINAALGTQLIVRWERIRHGLRDPEKHRPRPGR